MEQRRGGRVAGRFIPVAFNRPPLTDLIDRTRSELEASLGSAAPRLRYTVEGVLAKVMAGIAHGLYGYIAWAFEQIFPDTADGLYMRKWASFYGITPIEAIGAHSDTVTITGVNGSVCPAGTLWQRVDGVIYTQDAEATIASGVATIAVTATTTGLNTNAIAGTPLAIVSPVTGINSTATFTAAAVGGADPESDESVLTRLVQRLQFPPMGGGPGNYVSWTLEVAGVTRAWEIPLTNGPGTVGVMFMRDVNDPLLPDPTPTPDEITEVQEHIDSLAPLDADVYVFAPSGVTVITQTTPVPNTTAVKEAIAASVMDYIHRNGGPGKTITVSQISDAISNADGVISHTMVFPDEDITTLPTQVHLYVPPYWV